MTKILQISKRSVICRLLEILIFINLFFALFPAWHLSPLWNVIPTESYFSVWLSLAKKITIILCLFILLLDNKIHSQKLLIAISIVFIGVCISFFFNEFVLDTFYIIIFAPIEYIVLFIISKKYKMSKWITLCIMYILALWSILPLILLVIFPASYGVSMFVSLTGGISTFHGFALHRNFYGFYNGLTILIFLMSQSKTTIKIIVITSCLIGLLICGSRSSQLSTVIAILFILLIKNKKLFFIVMPIGCCFLILLSIIFQKLELRSANYADNDDRTEILKGFGNIISERPIIGHGKMTQYYPAGSIEEFPAHNFIAQIWADYGILTLTGFFLLITLAFFDTDLKFKVLFFYYLLIALVQPYFYVSLAWTYMVIIFLLGNCANFDMRNTTDKRRAIDSNHYKTSIIA